MILSDGNTWLPKGAQTHTTELMNEVNSILQQNNIRDDAGNQIQLTASFANAFYLLALAMGQRLADNDTLLAKGLDSFVVELCDSQQIENLLPVTGIERNTGSYSTLVLTCTASSSNACTIPAGTRAPFGDYYFVVQDTITIAAGTSENVPTVCDTVGPVVVLTGEIDSFETTIANLDSVTNAESSIPGTSPETTNELRRRIERGDTIDAGIDGLKYALEALSGISYARVYFNYNTSANITLPGGVVLPPRNAYIVVFGASAATAGVPALWARYLTAETKNTGTSRTQSGTYTTASGQIITVYWDKAAEQQIYVKIYLTADAETGTSVENELRKAMIASSASWGIGEELTSALLNKPYVGIDYTKVAYVKVSSNGTTWADMLTMGAHVMPRIQDGNITVESLT